MIKTSPWTGGTDEEYETQHFGFGSQRLKIAVRKMVEQKVITGVKEMESHLEKSLDLNETDKETWKRSCDKLIRLYCDRAGPSLEVIDSEIEQIVKVPPHVLLSKDEVQLKQVTDEEHKNLRQEVTNLRKRIERAALMEALLTEEEEELASVEKVCETAKKDMELLDLLHKNIEGDSMKTVQTATQFLCASAPFMNKGSTSIFDD